MTASDWPAVWAWLFAAPEVWASRLAGVLDVVGSPVIVAGVAVVVGVYLLADFVFLRVYR